MKKLLFIGLLLLSILVLLSSSCTTKCDCYDYTDGLVNEYDLSKSIIKVNATNFATGTETIFRNAYLRNQLLTDSVDHAAFCQAIINPVRFFSNESGYFFVESNNAWMVAHAEDTSLIGTYRYDVQDVNGKYYVRDMVEAVNYKGYGFVDYYFENPSDGQTGRKIGFVKSIPSMEFFIGTGFYETETDLFYDLESADLFLIENVTKSMAEGISGGLELYSDSLSGVEFCRSFIDNIRFFDNQSGYFFIYDFNCVNVAHGTQKDLQGKNLYDYQDSKGNYVIRDLVNLVKTNGSGYYKYYWNNPQTGKEEPKSAIVFKIPGIDYLIGSGVYY